MGSRVLGFQVKREWKRDPLKIAGENFFNLPLEPTLGGSGDVRKRKYHPEN